MSLGTGEKDSLEEEALVRRGIFLLIRSEEGEGEGEEEVEEVQLEVVYSPSMNYTSHISKAKTNLTKTYTRNERTGLMRYAGSALNKITRNLGGRGVRPPSSSKIRWWRFGTTGTHSPPIKFALWKREMDKETKGENKL
ncbi:hypothetical protein Salat_2687700 [Sesamum alatum]|uniref:Uncharacterized protein n=1 Tax=Sesamum alatum TaxID=300844 RepID=A0AAE2CB81_9LAMI|nr:hypothetical protein Salat_2687700 [Sesamum alatum]